MKSTASKLQQGGKDKIVVMNNASRTFGFQLLSCGATPMENMSDVLSHSEEEEEEDEDDDSHSQYDRPNRENSLMEDDEDDEENESVGKEQSKNSSRKPNEPRQFHPALMTAVLAEGQEAMWVEDEVSTVASVFVKPQVPVDNTKKKGRFRLSHMAPTIRIPEDEEFKPEEAQKIHVRKKKMKKAVLLLPQQEDEGAKALVEANVQQEAILNMVKARQLLNQALLTEGEPTLEESEMLAKVAFAHATTARRLMSKPEEEPDLEDILSILAEKGEHAAIQHQKIVFSQSFASKSIEEPQQKKKGMFSSASEYANKALHYLESILPKNIDKEIQESLSDTADTISTLGFKTDTFEYQMRPAPSQPTRSYTNMDLMSISSLNEILDGPLDDLNENKVPSPRQVLPVINVPNKTPKSRPAGPKEPSSFAEQLKKMVSPTSLVVPDKPEKSDGNLSGKVEALNVPPNTQRISKQQTSPQKQKMEEQQSQKEEEPLKIEDPPLKHRKSWGIMRRIRRGKHVASELPGIEATPMVEVANEGEHSSSSIESDTRDHPKSPGLISTIPTGPSKSFESEDQSSKISRYHIAKENKNIERDESLSTVSESKISTSEPVQHVQENESVDNDRRFDTAKSDWDQSASFQRRKVRAKPVVEEVVILAPSRSTPNPPSSNGPGIEKESDWDKSLDPCKMRMQRKSIANLSAEESSVGETAPEGVERNEGNKTPSRTPLSVATGRTNDMRSVQVHTGVETIMELDQESVRVLSVEETSIHTNEEDPAFSTSTEVLSKASHNETPREQETPTSKSEHETLTNKWEQETPANKCEHSTHAGNDSLIDFVISPRRANIITPGGGRPFDSERGDEPSRIIVPILQPMVEESFVDNRSENTPDEITEVQSTDHHHHVSHKAPKLMKRITRIFGSRKVKGPNKPDILDVEKPCSADKDIVQAMSDGNIQAFEDNLNAENAQLTVVSSQGGESLTSKGSNIDETPTVVLEKALSNAVSMAEEANLEVDTAPFPQRKSHRNPLMEKRPVPHDLVDAIRRQSGLERNRQKDRARDISRDAPGTSMHIKTDSDSDVLVGPIRLDPPKEDGTGYRVLAPTPRRKKATTERSGGDIKFEGDDYPSSVEKQDKNDQRRITELLYGPSASSENFGSRPRKVALKGMYIGDLIDVVETSSPPLPPSEENVPNTEACDVHAVDSKDSENDIHTTNSSANSLSNEDEIPDKENEDCLVSPKATTTHNTPKGGRPKGARKSMLFGIRNLISSGQ